MQEIVNEIMKHTLAEPIRALLIMLYFNDDRKSCWSQDEWEIISFNTVGELCHSSETTDFMEERDLIEMDLKFDVCPEFECLCVRQKYYLTEKGRKLAEYIDNTGQWALDTLYISEEACG